MSELFMGQITCFGFNFAPYGWAQCNGQLLPISQYSALFALLGTTFGGNGTSTFGLPNLQGAVPVGMGTSTTGTDYSLGETAGTEYVTLGNATIPPHTHTLSAAKTPGTKNALAANLIPAEGEKTGGQHKAPIGLYAPQSAGQLVPLAPVAISTAGGNMPHNNIQPTLTANWCIALQGVYPSRG